MDMGNVLSVGFEFDYPLKGGESLYDLLPVFNELFSLELTEDNFEDKKAVRRKSDGLVCISIINNDGDYICHFINMTNVGIEVIEDVVVIRVRPTTITARPLNFKEEIEFLSDVPLNTPIEYNPANSKKITMLQRRLIHYNYGNWNIVSTGPNIVADFILRYYGTGENVPPEYGTYSEEVMVAIIDLKKDGLYVTHCLRTKEYHVYSNGYRSGD